MKSRMEKNEVIWKGKAEGEGPEEGKKKGEGRER
jgi:hypothetical protein